MPDHPVDLGAIAQRVDMDAVVMDRADGVRVALRDRATLLRELQEARKVLREIVEARTDLLGKIEAARATLARCTDESEGRDV